MSMFDIRLLLFFIVSLSACKQTAYDDSHTYGDVSSVGKQNARAAYERMQLVNPSTGEIPKGIRQKEQMFAKTLAYQKSNDIIDNTEWINRGPYNVGGRTRAFAFDRTNDKLFLSGSVSGGVWKSEDGGDSWRKMNTFGNNISVTTITQDPREGFEHMWYYGTGESLGASQGLNASYNGSGIYVSEDYGENWRIVDSFDPGTPETFNDQREAVYEIIIDHTQEDLHMYVTTIGAIYRSVDNLETWRPVLITPLGSGLAYLIDLEISNDGIFYAGFSSSNAIIGIGVNNRGGVWRSTDGVSWTNLIDDTFPPMYNRIEMAINPSDQNEIYLVLGDVTPEFGKFTTFGSFGESYNALYRYNYISGDGTGDGGSWTTLTENVPNGNGFIDGFHTQGGYDMAIAIHPTQPNTVYIAGTNVYRSTDGFATSDNVSYLGGYEENSIRGNIKATKDFHPDIHGLSFLPSNPDVLYCFNDGGVYKTNDALADEVEWVSLNNGYLTTQYYTVFIDPGADDRIMAGAQDDALRVNDSEDPQVPWAKTLFGDGSYGAFTNTPNRLIASTQQGNIRIIEIDADNEIIAAERITPISEREDYLFIHPLAIDPNDDNILYLPFQNKFMVNTRIQEFELTGSLDSTAVGWHTLQDSLTQDGLIFTCIEAPSLPSGRIYMGTNNKRIFRLEDASDPSSLLIDITPAAGPNGAFVRSLTCDPQNSDRVIATYSNYGVYSIYITEDAGESWDRIAGNLEQFSSGAGNGPSVKWTGIQHIDDVTTVYWAGSSVGLYYTTTLSGTSTQWTLASPDLIGNNIISMIRTKERDNLIVVATHGNGIFSARIESGNSTSTNEITRQVNMNLFPNPTHDQLKVEWSEFDAVSYRSYTSNGRMLAQERLSTTDLSLTINVSDYPPGIYYLALRNAEGKELIQDFVVSR